MNPISTLLTLPLLLICSIPVAILACITTIFAFSILLFRVTLIYIDLAVAVIPYYLLGSKSLLPIAKSSSHPTPATNPTRRRKRRNSSTHSLSLSTGVVTPLSYPNSNSNSNSSLALSANVNQTRDFEGVGGWRLDNPNSEEEDALWTKINSRLELPAEHNRRHRRSLTGGSSSLEMEDRRRGREDGVVMNTGRVRNPPMGSAGVGGGGAEAYFPSVQISPKVGKRTMSLGTMSSGSSKGSGLSMKSK